ncbi:tryptophan 2,3-dioxygenase family protein [Catenuloplanes atrovinosus]|uniref:Tryptophan 2,3-dioxygenase n=1 Tax=Catenuloplanes atrovinosus TaxID=137266 RepID=A0AAE3YS80_9ACTN|nr:tryptophan 2,3-dioxygenase family protein [Catenuloplanes atrovinosus]MDR7277681.1 tryptophan 2,3-dioxygenase [Catenuloplanes atrovinosus]
MTQADAALSLAMWSGTDRPAAAAFPYEQVVLALLATGKHRADPGVVEALRSARARLTDVRGPQRQRARLARWLDIALDKSDGCYDYQSYLGLGVLPVFDLVHPPATAAAALRHHDRVLALLLSDLCRFEVSAAARQTHVLPRLRPGIDRVRKRCRFALAAARPGLGRLGLADQIYAEDPITAASQLVYVMDLLTNTDDHLILRLTMLPVDTYHDEYLFLRVLQCFELLFSLLVVDVQDVISSLFAGRARLASSRLDAATGVLQEAQALWPLIATMQPAAFAHFRQNTEGASAIQSRAYKLLESLCARPAEDRLSSVAYLSVPDVRAKIVAGQASLDEAFRATRDRFGAASVAELHQAMERFAVTILRWRRSHLGIATRMLGTDESGTGNTSGLPYLATEKDRQVFRTSP